MFAQDFLLSDVSVQGEVSNLKYHPTGHIYFSLKDEDAVISAVMFAGQRMRGLKCRLAEGMKVIVRGAVDIYEAGGRYQIYAKEIEEAASVDGCGFYGRFFRIVLPLTKTGVVTAATFAFLTCWNEFVYANLLTSSPQTKTIQIGIRYFTNQFSTDYVSMYAAIVIAIIPSIVIYMIFQEQIIAGLTGGAVKG
jgi:hypothetical protein